MQPITTINSFIRLMSYLISFFLILTASVFANEKTYDDFSELSMQGAAIYQELGKDYYIASLHLANKVPSVEASPAAMLNYQGEQRLKIKVIAKRWSARKWKAQWQNNIAINNSEIIDDELMDAELMAQLSHFTQFPKASLKKSDELLIGYHPETGSKVTFNGHTVLETDTKDFYNAILNTWLGKFSPNRIFREKLSGQLEVEERLIDLSAVFVDDERIAKVASWFTNKSKTSVSEAKPSRVSNTSEQELNQRAKEKQLALAKAERIEQERQRKAKLAKQAAEKQRKLALEKLAQQKLAQEKQAKQKLDQEKKAREKKAREQAAKEKAAREKAEKQRQNKRNEQDYLFKLYQYELQTKINESVKYPPWARQFNQEGLVILDFTLDSSGSLLTLDKTRSLASKILLQEVEKRLLALVETHQVPKALIGDSWAFTVQYDFKLNQPEQAPLEKPQLVMVD